MASTKKSLWAWFAIGLLSCNASAAFAETIVTSDSGTVGTFSLTNNGGGNMTLNMDGTELLTAINGNAVGPFTANFDASVAFKITPFGPHEYSVTSGTLSAMFTDASSGHAILDYSLTGAETGTVLVDNAFLSGPILSVVANGFSGFDFSKLQGGVENFALTSKRYTGASSMDDVFQNTGSSAIGSIAFSEGNGPAPQLTTPVPSTLMMALSVLITGVVIRAFKRWQVASVPD